MAEFLAEQMRSLARRLEELAQTPHMPEQGLKGSLNPKQLADLLGLEDLSTFTRSINKIRRGDADKLSRTEMTEMAEAFVKLLAAKPDDTQKVMNALKKVSAKDETVMEDSKYARGKKPVQDYTDDEMESLLTAVFDEFLHNFPRGKGENLDQYVSRLDFDKMEQMVKKKAH